LDINRAGYGTGSLVPEAARIRFTIFGGATISFALMVNHIDIFGVEPHGHLAGMEALYRDFGRRLRNARLGASLSQEALGRRVGLGRTSITNIEQGCQHVGIHLLYDLAKAVGTTPEDLLPDEAAVDGESLDQVPVEMRGHDDRG